MMESSVTRIAIVGASSLLGKELAEELGNSVFAAADVVLLDEEEATGQIASVGEEASFIRRIESTSFQGIDLVFFAGKPETTKKHWMAARKAGAGVLDLTDALANEPGAAILSPWVSSKKPDLATTVVLPAHILSVILGLTAIRTNPKSLAATILLPASHHHQAGMDELHQQTVKLLSFQSLPQDEFGAQTAFNLLPVLGAVAKRTLQQTAEHIRRDYDELGTLPELALQIIQAPVFHGYGISLLLDADRMMTEEELSGAIAGEHVMVVSDDHEDSPSNLSVAGQRNVLAKVSKGDGTRMWLWIAADNFKLTALHAIDCAIEFQEIRPKGRKQ